MDLLPGITGLSDSQPSSIAVLRGPQWRSLVSSPTVTKLSSGCLPIRRAASLGGSRFLKDCEATSVSRTTAPADGSGKVCVARLGDEGEELIEFFVGLESVATQLVDRLDGVGARRLPDQFLQRHQITMARIGRVLGATARRNHLRRVRDSSVASCGRCG
jgi:hypothetical protein